MGLTTKSASELRHERESAGMIISRWQPWFTQQYGGTFPVNRFHYDVESSGFSRKDDVIVEWGHCMVRDGKVVDRNNVVINWFLCPDSIPADRLRYQLERVAREMRQAARSWRLTEKILREEGVHPDKAIPWIYDLLTSVQDQGMMLVSHNGWNFDNPMLLEHFKQDMNKDFVFNPNQLFDTGCIEKATQLMEVNPERALPQQGESLLAYFKRISGWRATGVYHNLDSHCVKKYRLVEKYGIDPYALHTAGEDAYVLHLLMEEFKLLTEAQQVDPGYQCPQCGQHVANHAAWCKVDPARGLPSRPGPAPRRPVLAAKPATTPATTALPPQFKPKQRNR